MWKNILRVEAAFLFIMLGFILGHLVTVYIVVQIPPGQ